MRKTSRTKADMARYLDDRIQELGFDEARKRVNARGRGVERARDGQALINAIQNGGAERVIKNGFFMGEMLRLKDDLE